MRTKRVCDECDGTRKDKSGKTCAKCDGKRYFYVEARRCPKCGGYEIERQNCKHCKTTGINPKDWEEIGINPDVI
jgi:DnaJ-class molecular chaperone